jgi:hypothetical protein
VTRARCDAPALGVPVVDELARARQRRDLREGLARSIKLSSEPCPACEVAWNLHTVPQVFNCCERLMAMSKEPA